MKRSEINCTIAEGIAFLRAYNRFLMPQASWDLRQWLSHREEAEEMRKRGIGWDITDFGSGDFNSTGLLLYTLSNGLFVEGSGRPLDQPYANKLLLVGSGQVTPTHHHWKKIEDIINQGGGILEVQLHNVGPDDSLDKASEVRVFYNNAWATFPAGTVLSLNPGERIRLDTHHYHKFWGSNKTGQVIAEEVSSINDDLNDNCFLAEENVGRFPQIEEDAEPKYLLCNELPGTEKFRQLVHI